MKVRTYEDLEFYMDMFKKGNTDLLIISSSGGMGKSRLVEDMMKEIGHVRILSHISPMALYIIGYEHTGKPIIFDDVDMLINNKENISLLKQFCETSKTKEIGWATTSRILDSVEVPHKYETKSRVLIITNDFSKLNKNVGALADRGWNVQFEPTIDEILNKIEEIKDGLDNGLTYEEKEEVFQLIKKFAKFGNISLRTFVKGCQLYKHCNGNGGWEDRLLAEIGVEPKLQIIDKLLSEYETEKERLAIWTEKYGLSRRSYYDWKNKLVQKCSKNEEMHIEKMPALMHN